MSISVRLLTVSMLAVFAAGVIGAPVEAAADPDSVDPDTSVQDAMNPRPMPKVMSAKPVMNDPGSVWGVPGQEWFMQFDSGQYLPVDPGDIGTGILAPQGVVQNAMNPRPMPKVMGPKPPVSAPIIGRIHDLRPGT